MAVKVVASVSQADGRGTYIVNKKTPRAPVAVGTSRAVMIAQMPWGPTNVLTPFTDPATFRATFAPDGFDRTGQGYLMATRFPWPDLHIVRPIGTAAAKAFVQLQDSVPANSLKFEALYFGTGGNGISITIAAASNAVVNSFNLTVSKTDSSTGQETREVYENVDSTKATGDAYWTTLFASSKLLGPATRNAGGRPVNGNFTFASGADGTVNSGAYLGTQGSFDKGLALAENDPDVNFVFTDDPGGTDLAAVNAGLKSHCLYMGDRRIAFTQGLPGETKSTAEANVLLNASDTVGYVWGHGKVRDDQGTLRTIPLTGPLAALACAMPPHLSLAYKDSDYTKVLANLVDIDVATGSSQVKSDCEKKNIIAFEKNSDSVFSPYAGVMSDGTPAYVKRMRDYIGFTIAGALTSSQGGLNEELTLEDERDLITGVLNTLQNNRKINRYAFPSILAYALLDIEETNTQASIDAGDAVHGIQVKLIAERRRTFLQQEVSTTVNLTVRLVA